MSSRAGRTKDEVENFILQQRFEKEACWKALIDLVVQCRLPLEIVESPAFHGLLSSLNPVAKDILPLSQNTLQSDILTSWSEEKVILQNHLRTAVSKINISLDIWTSGHLQVEISFLESWLTTYDTKVR
jgi:hypothetical protein